MRPTPLFLMRKIRGRFDACRGSTSGLGSPRRANTTLLPALGAFCAALMLPLLVLALLVAAVALGHAHPMALAAGHAPVLGAFAVAGTTELKDTIDELRGAFDKFKQANDTRLQEIEANGQTSAESTAVVDRLNAALTELQGKVAAQAQQLREVETAAARIPNGQSAETREREASHARQFLSLTRGQPIDAVSDSDLDQYRAYRRAFAAYLRRGDAVGPEHRAALQTGSAPDGGFWVVPDVTGRIVELLYQTSPVRQIASVQPIGTDTLEGFNDLDEADSGWVSEQGDRGDSATPQTSKWAIPVHEQFSQPKATQKQLDDSMFDVEAWLAKKVAAKLARAENAAFVGGNGVGQPRGFTTYPAGVPGKAAWQKIEQIHSGAAGAFAAASPGDELIDMVTHLKAELRQGATWAMNSLTVGAVRKLKDGDGNYLWQPSFQDGLVGQLLGYPIAELQDMADIAANSLSLAFGNFKEGYQIVDHTIGVRLLRDPFTAKPFIKFYTTKRVGGDVVNFEAIKLMKFAV